MIALVVGATIGLHHFVCMHRHAHGMCALIVCRTPTTPPPPQSAFCGLNLTDFTVVCEGGGNAVHLAIVPASKVVALGDHLGLVCTAD